MDGLYMVYNGTPYIKMDDLGVPSFLETSIPIGSMYGIFAYICHQNQPNVGKYTIHGSYGIYQLGFWHSPRMPSTDHSN